MESKTNNSEVNDATVQGQGVVTNPFRGSIYANAAQIKVELELKVYSPDCVYANKFKIINDETNMHTAIVFMYRHSSDPDYIDYEANKGFWMPISFTTANLHGWSSGKAVRLMCLNENSETEFDNLNIYFKAHLDEFKDVLYPSAVYDSFINAWNLGNPTRRVASNNIPPNKIVKPRFTKDDGMLNLKAFTLIE